MLTTSPRALAPKRGFAARALAGIVASAFALTGLAAVAPAQAAPADHGQFEGRDLLYREHVDAAQINWEGDPETGHLSFKVVDGLDPRPVDEVYVRLGPDATADGTEVSRMRVPNDPAWSLLGEPGDILWQAPAQYYDGWVPVWAGLGAGKIPSTVLPETIEMELVDGGGPGDLTIYQQRFTDPPRFELSTIGDDRRFLPMLPSGHGHYNWAFTEPGRYDTQWRAHAAKADGTKIESEIYTVTWLVGTDEELGIPAGTTKAAPITIPVEDQPIPGPGDPIVELPAPGSDVDPLAFNPTKGTRDLTQCNIIEEGHLDIRAAAPAGEGISVSLRHDNPDGTQSTYPGFSTVITVPESSLIDVAGDLRSGDLASIVGTGSKYVLPQVQEAGIPWPGFSTEDIDYSDVDEIVFGQGP